jgi:hypothetical protein
LILSQYFYFKHVISTASTESNIIEIEKKRIGRTESTRMSDGGLRRPTRNASSGRGAARDRLRPFPALFRLRQIDIGPWWRPEPSPRFSSAIRRQRQELPSTRRTARTRRVATLPSAATHAEVVLGLSLSAAR